MVEKYIIPRKKLPEGIKLCKDEIMNYLADAKLLLKNSSIHHASIMVQFACEELGKANKLKKKFEESKPNDMVEVEKRLFRNHIYKQEECWKLIGKELQLIFKGGFNRDAFTRRAALINELMDHKTRLDASFVNWNKYEQDWEVIPRIEKKKLQKIIEAIEEKLPYY
jgi:AbiV family abortive infection protein